MKSYAHLHVACWLTSSKRSSAKADAPKSMTICLPWSDRARLSRRAWPNYTLSVSSSTSGIQSTAFASHRDLAQCPFEARCDGDQRHRTLSAQALLPTPVTAASVYHAKHGAAPSGVGHGAAGWGLAEQGRLVTHSEGAGARSAKPTLDRSRREPCSGREFRRRRCPDGLWWSQGARDTFLDGRRRKA